MRLSKQLFHFTSIGLLFFFLNINMLYPILAGKIKKESKVAVTWLYGENKKSRTIAFIEFENLTKSRASDFDNYKTSIPQIIAEKIKNIHSLTTTSNDFIPTFKNSKTAYLVKSISFKEAKKNKKLMEEIFNYRKVISPNLLPINTNSTTALNKDNEDLYKTTIVTNVYTNSEYYITNFSATGSGDYIYTNIITNRIKKKFLENANFFSLLTNHSVAYWKTNHANKKYDFYIFKKNPSQYFDAELIAPYLKYFSNQNLGMKTDQEGRIYYPLDRNSKKKLILDQKIYRLNQAPLGNIIKKKEVDYFVYGSYQVKKNTMNLNIYIIHVKDKKIVHIHSDKFHNRKIRSRIKSLDLIILSYLQKKKLIKNLNFVSKPKGALLYLNKRFIGILPKKIEKWIEGSYTYEIWKPNSKLITASKNKDNINKKSMDLKNSNEKIEFNFEEEKQTGILEIEIKNKIKSDIYINSKLLSRGEKKISHKLNQGNYFVSVTRSNYTSRNFKVEIESEETTKLLFEIEKIKPKTSWEMIFENYTLNAKIFSSLGLAFGAATIGTYIYTLNLEDKKNASGKRISDLSASGQSTLTEEEYKKNITSDYQKFLGISLGLLSGTLISFTVMTVFHVLDIWGKQAPIETRFNHNSDVEFVYKKEF